MNPRTEEVTDEQPPDLRAVEVWFVERGVPHFVEGTSDGSMLDTWTRALPLLLAGSLLRGFYALDLANWSLLTNLAAAALVLAILVASWALSNRLRGIPTFARPTDIDAPELALFIIAPAVPILVLEQMTDALVSVLWGFGLLAFTYVWSSYGVGPLLRWGWRRGWGQLAGLGSLVARALPLLLLFNTFLFINAEVWEVAGTLTGPPFLMTLATFVVLGAAFALTRVPNVMRTLNSFSTWEEVATEASSTPAAHLPLPTGPIEPDRLRHRQRLNIALVVLFGQALQITLVAIALIGFFVLFGFFAITEATVMNWTGLDDVHVFVEATIGGRTLVLSEPLLRVSVFLGAFSGMYFTVVLTTDETYRNEFTDDVGPQIRSALAARSAYRVARGTHPQSGDIERSPSR